MKKKEDENITGTGYHYSKEFKDRFISEWDNKYRVLFKEIIPDRSMVRTIFLVPMADLMLKEFPDEALRHNGDDKNKLVRNLYHRYIKWIENPTKELLEKYKISGSEIASHIAIVENTENSMYVDDGYVESNVLTYTDDRNENENETFYEKKNVPEVCDLKKYNITLQYAKPKFGIVFNWITVSFDVVAEDEIGAIAKAYECLWRKTGDVCNTRIREKSILVGGR